MKQIVLAIASDLLGLFIQVELDNTKRWRVENDTGHAKAALIRLNEVGTLRKTHRLHVSILGFR